MQFKEVWPKESATMCFLKMLQKSRKTIIIIIKKRRIQIGKPVNIKVKLRGRFTKLAVGPIIKNG